jgi:hypothetical protein
MPRRIVRPTRASLPSGAPDRRRGRAAHPASTSAAGAALQRKPEQDAPRPVCFNGRGVYTHVFGTPPDGLGPRPGQLIGGSQVAVTPSSSGQASRWSAERLAAFRAIAAGRGRA